MLQHKTDGVRTIKDYADVVNARGNVDYLQNGVIHKNADTQMVLVSSQSDLSQLTDYAPGTIAFTAGFGSLWQKAPNGTWAAFA